MNEQLTVREKIVVAICMFLVKIIGKYNFSEEHKKLVQDIETLTK